MVRITRSWAGAEREVTRAVRIGQSWIPRWLCKSESFFRNRAKGPSASGSLARLLSFSSKASSPCSLKIRSDSSVNSTASPSKAMRTCPSIRPSGITVEEPSPPAPQFPPRLSLSACLLPFLLDAAHMAITWPDPFVPSVRAVPDWPGPWGDDVHASICPCPPPARPVQIMPAAMPLSMALCTSSSQAERNRSVWKASRYGAREAPLTSTDLVMGSP